LTSRARPWAIAAVALVGVWSSSSSAPQTEPLASYLDALAQIKAGRLETAVGTLQEILERSPDFDRAYGKLIEVYHRLDRDDEARAYFESLLARDPASPFPLYGLGLFFRQRGDLTSAATRLEDCAARAPGFAPVYPELLQQLDPDEASLERIARSLEQSLRLDPENAGALLGMSLVHRRRQDEAGRARFLQDAVRANPGLWEALLELASFRANQGAIEEELGGLAELLQSLTSSGDRERVARVLSRIGDVYLETQQFEPAMDSFRRSLALAADVGDSRTEMLAASRIGIVDQQQGRYREALDWYERGLAVSREMGDRQSEGRMLGLLADLQAELAEYPDAIASFSEAIAIARAAEDRGSEAQQLASLGSVYIALGDADKAVEHLERALVLARDLGDRGIEQEFLSRLGLAHEKKGELREALVAYEESARVAQGLSDREAEATRLGYAGNVYARLGDSAEALRHYQQGLGIAREIGTIAVEAEISNDLAALRLKLGDIAESIELHLRALSIGETTRNLPLVFRAEAGLGAALDRRGETAGALDHYRRAIESVEAVRGKIDLAQERAAFFQDKVEAYRKAVDLLLRLEEADPTRGHAVEAFRYSERARARAFLDLMAEARLNVEAGIAPELLARQRELGQRLSEIQSRLIGAHSAKAAPAEIAALERALERADDDSLSLSREVRRLYPHYAELQYPEPPPLAEVQKLLGEKTLLLEYLVGEEGSFLFAVRRDGYRVARLPAGPRLREAVSRLREAVSRPDRAALSTYVSLAKRLHDELVLPAKDIAGQVEEIVVAPDDILHYLPFELLLTTTPPSAFRSDPRHLPYLIRDFRVSYLPAAGILPTLGRAMPPETPRKDLLALGDPSYDRRESVPGREGEAPLRSAFERERPWMLRRLAHSRDEVTRIASLYPKDGVDLLLGDEATEENLKADGRLGRYRILHLAAHGLLNESRPQFSGLVVSLPQAGPAALGRAHEDGLVQVYEIFNMKLNADLVVLSACETGLGQEIRGEGVVGLTRAFLYAGTPAVVVSLWKVADASTAELMVRFHHRLQGGDRSPSEALRRAQLDLVDGTGFAHPYYWAPFVLVGKP
jgi:CHAT domain-containing protein/tetratricopeptide (TPR) repeat protein